jgi:hypothetical protein
MPSYLAVVTVHADLDADGLGGLADALGARETRDDGGRVVLWVPGEAPDLATAVDAARRHAAEVLDDLPHEVEVHETPTS